MDGLDLVNKLWYVVYKGKERYLRFAFGWKMICDALEIGEWNATSYIYTIIVFSFRILHCNTFVKIVNISNFAYEYTTGGIIVVSSIKSKTLQ